MQRARYRIGQGVRALLAFARAPDLEAAALRLNECELRAFRAMSRSEQLHSLEVLRRILNEDGEAETALQRAALLHDVGKSRHRLAVWQKTFGVIVSASWPRLARAWGGGDRLSWWRAPFVVRRRHAGWGGDILRACGSDAETIWLVERHQRDADGLRDHRLWRSLAALQRADNAG